jgi:pre-60S factor REI1
VHSVRAHMVSKGHIKIPYESTEQKLELSDFYDFTSSYDKPKRASRSTKVTDDGDEEWEDVSEESEDLSDEEIPEDVIETNGFELMLAPGLRAGHRSLQRYYRQNFAPGQPATEGQGTVLAVDRRYSGALQIRDPVQLKAQKRVWKEEKKQRNIAYRRDKFVNNQPHYRDELLQ